MTELEQTVAALAERVAILESENARLRGAWESRPTVPDARRVRSRRGLLVGAPVCSARSQGPASSRPPRRERREPHRRRGSFALAG